MASPLTVTTSAAGVRTSKGFGTPAAPEAGQDVFASLLGAADDVPAVPETRPSSDDVNMALGFKSGGDGKPDDPEAIAAVIDAQIALAPVETAKPELTELVQGLADLKARLAAGEPLDPEALKRLDAMLGDLAKSLNIDLTDIPSADELAALMAGKDGSDASLSGKLVEAFGPLAGALLGHTDADASAELSSQVKAVGDKLAAILTALNQGEANTEQLAQIQQDLATDTELKAALDRALKPTIAADAAPLLATPTLQLTEAALTGKGKAEVVAKPDLEATSDAPRNGDAPLEAKPLSKDGGKTADRSIDKPADDTQPADTKPNGVAAATADKQPDAQGNVQTLQTARVDAVAAPRVVQTGYQTSQQQLNLPQLAFEMVRQVGDGNSRFQIRLDPAELGKIDVRLDIDATGKVHARLTVEKAETLDLMQRDQKGLERALQQAGLDSSKTSLEFSLKQNPFGGGQQGQDGNGRNSLFGNDMAEVDELPPPTVNLYRASLTASGVNIIA